MENTEKKVQEENISHQSSFIKKKKIAIEKEKITYSKNKLISLLSLFLSFGLLFILEKLGLISEFSGFILFPILYIVLYLTFGKKFNFKENFFGILFLIFITIFSLVEIYKLNENISYKTNNKIESLENDIIILKNDSYSRLKKICKEEKKCLEFIEKVRNSNKRIALEYCSNGYGKDKNWEIPEKLSSHIVCEKKENNNPFRNYTIKKPIIYLYPQKTQKIKIKLDYKGKIIADYPEYDEKIKGWEVLAYPDSKVIDLKDKREYSYIFWEGKPENKIDWDLDRGFVVEGKNVREFLREKLEKLGLTPKEYNEFIVYWYPEMMDNKYNLVHFATKKYTDSAPLEITPKPDSMLRVFMVFKKLDKKIKIKKQKLESFERKGFAVIEWGGVEVE